MLFIWSKKFFPSGDVDEYTPFVTRFAWPEFLYGGLSVDAYARLVCETRDVNAELRHLTNVPTYLMLHPAPTQEEQTSRLSSVVRATLAIRKHDDPTWQSLEEFLSTTHSHHAASPS
jgi:hypothetical protein